MRGNSTHVKLYFKHGAGINHTIYIYIVKESIYKVIYFSVKSKLYFDLIFTH
jgi:hypothetical protein